MPAGMGKLFGGQARHQQQVTAARAVFEEECRKHAAAEADRQRQLGAYPAEFKHWCEKVEADVAAHNAQVDKFAADLSRAGAALQRKFVRDMRA